jgi:hypothetical protein
VYIELNIVDEEGSRVGRALSSRRITPKIETELGGR